jgi:hypothetical protein
MIVIVHDRRAITTTEGSPWIHLGLFIKDNMISTCSSSSLPETCRFYSWRVSSHRSVFFNTFLNPVVVLMNSLSNVPRDCSPPILLFSPKWRFDRSSAKDRHHPIENWDSPPKTLHNTKVPAWLLAELSVNICSHRTRQANHLWIFWRHWKARISERVGLVAEGWEVRRRRRRHGCCCVIDDGGCDGGQSMEVDGRWLKMQERGREMSDGDEFRFKKRRTWPKETWQNSVKFSRLVFSGVVKKGAGVETDRNLSKPAGFRPRSGLSARWSSRDLGSEEQLDQYLF